jgi:hypothetical protein
MGANPKFLEEAALEVAERFRGGAFGPWQGEGVDPGAAVVAAVGDLNERCVGFSEEQYERAFLAALLWTR